MSQTKNSILALIVLSALCPLSTHAFVNPSGSTTTSTRSSLSFNSIHHHYQQSQSHSKTTTRQHLDKIEHGLNLGRIRSSSSSSRTRMNMVAAVAAAPAATGAAAAMGVISGGILGGALHAIAGKLHKILFFKKPIGTYITFDQYVVVVVTVMVMVTKRDIFKKVFTHGVSYDT